MKGYLKKVAESLTDADTLGIEFLLMWVVFALLALVALGVESLIWRWLGG